MMRTIFIAILLGMYSCKDGRISRYERLVDKTDRILITNREQHDSLVVAASPMLNKLKHVLKRNINPESPRKFLVERSIALYSGGQKTGVLLVSYGVKPYVNFSSDSLNMTFPLTYGIGMALDQLTSKNSR